MQLWLPLEVKIKREREREREKKGGREGRTEGGEVEKRGRKERKK